MSFKDIQAGRYKATVLKAQFAKADNDKRTPCISVLMEFESKPGTFDSLWWTGWLSENALEHTLRALAVLGYDESKKPDAGGMVPKEHFDLTAEVEITIKEETYDKAGETKSTMKITWVDRPSGSRFSELPQEEVSSMIGGLDLKNKMAEARAKLGVKKKVIVNHADKLQKPDPSAVPF